MRIRILPVVVLVAASSGAEEPPTPKLQIEATVSGGGPLCSLAQRPVSFPRERQITPEPMRKSCGELEADGKSFSLIRIVVRNRAKVPADLRLDVLRQVHLTGRRGKTVEPVAWQDSVADDKGARFIVNPDSRLSGSIRTGDRVELAFAFATALQSLPSDARLLMDGVGEAPLGIDEAKAAVGMVQVIGVLALSDGRPLADKTVMAGKSSNGGFAYDVKNGVVQNPSATTDATGRFILTLTKEFLGAERKFQIRAYSPATGMLAPLKDAQGAVIEFKIDENTPKLELGTIKPGGARSD